LLAGCGYAVERGGGGLPAGTRRVAVPYVKNASTRVGVASLLTDELRRQFTTSKFLRLVDEDQAPDAVLEVSILSVKVEGATLTDIAHSSSRWVVITVDAVLRQAGSGKVIWEERRIVDRQSYVVAGDQVTTESNAALAMKKLTQDLAERIHNHLFNVF
jgi:hypothetical protein